MNQMPVFIIKGKDQLAPAAVDAYHDLCVEYGINDQARQVFAAGQEIRAWQEAHPDQVKLPDHQHVPAAALPPAWADLLEGLRILAPHQNNNTSPFNCSHDQLTVMADPSAFTEDQIAHLERLGFIADPGHEVFYSFKFGSA